MGDGSDNEMKIASDNSINIDTFRNLVQTYLNMNLYGSALFWADKVVALSSGAPKDVYWLAQCMYLLKQYHRAAQLIVNRDLEKNYISCNYLAVKCLYEAHEYTDALRVLNTINVEMFDGSLSFGESSSIIGGYFDDIPVHKMQAAVMLLKGRLLEAMDNRGLAALCYRQALQYDVNCFEAFEALVQHQMLSSTEEEDLINDLPIKRQCNTMEGLFLKMMYQSRLKKYHSVTHFVSKLFPDIEEEVLSPVSENVSYTEAPSHSSTECSWTINSPTQLPATIISKMQNSLDLVVSKAEKLYYDCDYEKCRSVTEFVLKKDPFHTDCLPVHIACLVELKDSNALFSLAHRLVDLQPEATISWFGVGCYYYVIGKSDPARRYLSKATSLDRLFGPAWLAYGHSFAVENEHDQAMAAYFKASQLMRGCHLPLLYIGLECGLTKNVRLADKFFYQAQKIAPEDPFVMHEMGVVAFQNSDYLVAEKYFTDALNRLRENENKMLAEKWEPLLNNLGHVSRKLKKYEKALEYHHQALVLRPKNPGSYSAIAYTKALMGLTEESVDWFHKALGLKREDTFSTTMLNYVIEQLAEDSLPFPNAPETVPDFNDYLKMNSDNDDSSKDVYIDTSDTEDKDTENQNTQESMADMSMSFEVEMPDAATGSKPSNF